MCEFGMGWRLCCRAGRAGRAVIGGAAPVAKFAAAMSISSTDGRPTTATLSGGVDGLGKAVRAEQSSSPYS